jgi:hypothetical protein
MGRTFDYTQTGSEITAGPGEVGVLQRELHLRRQLRHRRVHQDLPLQPRQRGHLRDPPRHGGRSRRHDADYQKILRKNIGLTLGQFNPA